MWPLGEGQGKVGQIIRVFVRDPAYHQAKREHGGKHQPPVSARSGSARIAHHGRQFYLAGLCSDREPWGKRIIQPVVPMPCHRKVRAVGGRRRLQDGQARTGPAIPGVSRDLRDRYRQQREKERENPPHSYPAHSAYLVYFVR